MKKAILVLLVFAVCFPCAQAVMGENIDLVTLPSREGVQLTIYNSEDITLVKETRFITLKTGSNRLQFSWANTLIDPTSVEIRALEHKADIEIVDTMFPGLKPQHLIWNIESKFEGQVRMEVSYFTSGLTWAMDYVGVADPDETKMKFRGYVRVSNASGEDYERANIRLIVGTINLVEKIAELARRRGVPVPPEGTEYYDDFNELAAREMMDPQAPSDQPSSDDAIGALGIGGGAPRKKEIIKEGLSEYFIFSIEGTETIANGASKRMEAVTADGVSFDIIYRMRDYQYGPRPVRFFIWNNDAEHSLGDSPLPDGLIRLYRENGREGLSFLGQQRVEYVPVKAAIEINLGTDDLVVYEPVKSNTQRSNFHFRADARPEFVDGWDERQYWTDGIRNYRGKPIMFELRRIWGGDVELTADPATMLFDFQTTETKLTIPANSRKTIAFTFTGHNGSNGKQNRVLLK
ncbi:MAG: hypothetical protein WC712_04370 [Candidatus Brocadiia bacterium]